MILIHMFENESTFALNNSYFVFQITKSPGGTAALLNACCGTCNFDLGSTWFNFPLFHSSIMHYRHTKIVENRGRTLTALLLSCPNKFELIAI